MNIGLALFLSVGALAVFTFLSIVVFSEARSKERIEYHRGETLRKVAEQSGEGAKVVLEVIREEEQIAERKRVEGIKLGGLITTVTGIGLGIFLYNLAPEVVAVSLIPFLVGIAMLVYVGFMLPRDN